MFIRKNINATALNNILWDLENRSKTIPVIIPYNIPADEISIPEEFSID